MISTQNYNDLPSQDKLQKICKSISVLDAILSPEWEYRYYSYNENWADGEEFFEMSDGSGDQMLILFHKKGCVINGFAHEFETKNKAELTDNLPPIFNEFIFGEPVKTIGTSFCLWTNELDHWKTGKLENFEDNSAEMLSILDGNPQTYIDWATDYFEDSYSESGISYEIVNQIYNGEQLTKEMVLQIVDHLDDWKQLESDLEEIGYPYNFNK